MLLPEERFRLTLFVSTIVMVYTIATSIVFRWLFDKSPESPRERRFRRWRIGVVVLAVLGMGAGIYGHFVEPYWLQVNEVTIKSPKVKKPIRLVQISDTHCDLIVRLEHKLPGII